MNLRSKFRLDVLLIVVVVLAVLTFVPWLALSKSAAHFSSSHLKDPSLILLFIFLGIIYGGIMLYLFYQVITKTLWVNINQTEKIICFNYPLKFKKSKYNFEEITGFRFSSMHTRICDFKTLIVKTNNHKQYIISEFQLANFNCFETYLLSAFELKKGKAFKDLSEAEKNAELLNNKIFEKEQSKSYRFFCYVNIVLIVFTIYLNEAIALQDRKFGWMGYGICLGYFVYLLNKIRNANNTLKKES